MTRAPEAELDLVTIRARADAMASSLRITLPFDISSLIADLAARRGRPIHLHAHPSSPGPCGAWISMPSGDHVFYDALTSRVHQQHIVLHELGHVVADHQGTDLRADLLQRLFPDFDPTMVVRVLGRSSYTHADEVEAEMFASSVAQRVATLARSRLSRGDEVADDVAARLESALTGPRPTA